MPRKLTIFALVIIVLHIFSAAILGPSPAGTLIGNSLQIMACALAVAMTFAASRRGRGLTRPFWLLVGCGLAVWGVANLGWMYYELALHREPPTGSDTALVALAILQMVRARTKHLRKLYGGFAIYLLGYTVCARLADYAQSI